MRARAGLLVTNHCDVREQDHFCLSYERLVGFLSVVLKNVVGELMR